MGQFVLPWIYTARSSAEVNALFYPDRPQIPATTQFSTFFMDPQEKRDQLPNRKKIVTHGSASALGESPDDVRVAGITGRREAVTE